MSLACNTSGVGTGADARHLELLERAVSLALSPLEFSDSAAWGQAFTRALCAVAGATSGGFLLPDSADRWQCVSCTNLTEPAHVAQCHEETTERLSDRVGGDSVLWARDDLGEGGSAASTPCGASTIGIRVRTGNGSVAAVYACRDRSLGRVPPYVIAALRAIAPAFRAGLSARLSHGGSRSSIARMLDSLTDPALLFDGSGGLLHLNPAADRLMRSTDAARLRGEGQRIAFGVGAAARRSRAAGPGSSDPCRTAANRTVRIGARVYQLRGAVVAEQLMASEPALLVTVTASMAEPLGDDTLHAQYGLTAREVQVARLIAAGLSNNAIADRLGVRFFTARNHVERTLSKLGVTSRHRVGPLLRNEAAGEVGLNAA